MTLVVTAQPKVDETLPEFDVRWTDEAMCLLDLYVRGFVPADVARVLVDKYRDLPENLGRDIFDSNPILPKAEEESELNRPQRSDDTRKKFVLEAIFERRKTEPKCGWLDRLEDCNFGSFHTYSGIVADYALNQLAERTAEVERLKSLNEVLAESCNFKLQGGAEVISYALSKHEETIAAQRERIASLESAQEGWSLTFETQKENSDNNE